jgi:hypothetical protein
VGKQSIPTTGLSPASRTALWAAGHRLLLALFQVVTLSTPRAARNPGPALLLAQVTHISSFRLQPFAFSFWTALLIARGKHIADIYILQHHAQFDSHHGAVAL